MPKPLVNLFLQLNKFFPEAQHPFNQTGGKTLPYTEYEYKHAEQTYQQFDVIFNGGFTGWIRGKKLVDFACGGGGKSVYLALSGAEEVIGLDTESGFIDQAGNFAQEKNAQNCKFFIRDVRKSGLASDTYDAVILNDAIDHIPQPKEALKEALRILKPGGRIFINFESYYYFWGHHLWDAIRIPWLHLFTTEKFRIDLYREAVSRFPNANERINFRISKDEKGKERITYLNHLTIRKFRKMIGNLEWEGKLKIEKMHQKTLRRQPFRILAKVPGINEFFLSTLLCILKKP